MHTYACAHAIRTTCTSYTYMHVCIHYIDNSNIYIYIYTYIYIYVSLYIRVFVYIYIYIGGRMLRVHLTTYSIYTCSYVYLSIYLSIDLSISLYIHIYIYIYIVNTPVHVCIYIYIYTYTHDVGNFIPHISYICTVLCYVPQTRANLRAHTHCAPASRRRPVSDSEARLIKRALRSPPPSRYS